MDIEARVWQAYNKEAELKDNEMVARMEGNLDAQLIFVRIPLHSFFQSAPLRNG